MSGLRPAPLLHFPGTTKTTLNLPVPLLPHRHRWPECRSRRFRRGSDQALPRASSAALATHKSSRTTLPSSLASARAGRTRRVRQTVHSLCSSLSYLSHLLSRPSWRCASPLLLSAPSLSCRFCPAAWPGLSRPSWRSASRRSLPLVVRRTHLPGQSRSAISVHVTRLPLAFRLPSWSAALRPGWLSRPSWRCASPLLLPRRLCPAIWPGLSAAPADVPHHAAPFRSSPALLICRSAKARPLPDFPGPDRTSQPPQLTLRIPILLPSWSCYLRLPLTACEPSYLSRPGARSASRHSLLFAIDLCSVRTERPSCPGACHAMPGSPWSSAVRVAGSATWLPQSPQWMPCVVARLFMFLACAIRRDRPWAS